MRKLTESVIYYVAGFALVAIAATSARASEVEISGSGTFSGTAPTTAESKAGDTWSFSFDLPNPISGNPTTQAVNFSYFLDGTPVGVSLTQVQFFSSGLGGLFDLTLSDTHILSYYGANIETSNTLSLGTFAATACPNDAAACGSGSVTVSAVPLPASAWLMLSALIGFGTMVPWRRAGNSGLRLA